ncbi:MAG: DNA methyltransferase [archaeon]
MKTFFILGRNPELSRQEILTYLEARNKNSKEILFEENYLIIETEEKFNIQELGGVLKLGTVEFEGNLRDFQNYLNKNEIVPADKFAYSLFGNFEPEILKEKFKKERKKAVLKHGGRQLKFQSGEKTNISKTRFSLFLHEKNNKIYFGRVTQDYDYEQIENRDMNKPTRREQLAISPRLSKILINLSGAKPNDLLLDPFCGVGPILQEALIKNIKVYGIDKDKEAIIDAEKNIKWLKQNYQINSEYKLENIDAKKTPDLQFRAIATETPLGKLLKKKQTNEEAEQAIQNFESFIIPVLRRLKKSKKPKAKIAITFPVVRRFRVNAKKIAEKSGLKILIGPIEESRPDQFISRDILVFE